MGDTNADRPFTAALGYVERTGYVVAVRLEGEGPEHFGPFTKRADAEAWMLRPPFDLTEFDSYEITIEDLYLAKQDSAGMSAATETRAEGGAS